MQCTDALFALWPQPVPTRNALKNCKIISHRGEHDNLTVFENTLAAFDKVLQQEIWGTECDIRWTRDLTPVIIHDTSGQRVFGKQLFINQVDPRFARPVYFQVFFYNLVSYRVGSFLVQSKDIVIKSEFFYTKPFLIAI